MAAFGAGGKRRKPDQNSQVRSHQDWQQLCGEFNICKRKVQAKSEALLVLAKELDNVRQEKDAYKLMAEQLREKFHAQRRKYEERERALGLSLHDGDPVAERRNHSLIQILCHSREKTRLAELEVSELRQKLSEAEGDIKLLRESIARQRIGDEGIGTRHFPAHEREELIRQLEKSREQIESLERDMVAKIDEQQEFVTERDYYRTKTERLNQELNYVLDGDDRRIVDVDALVMENKYLNEKINQSLEEKASLQGTLTKYKAALERRKGKGLPRLGGSGAAVLSTKDVENLLAQGKSGGLSASPASVADLQALATSLLESIHDKNLALSHQKNTNKILGQRVAELEKKLKTLEVAGLWNLPPSTAARSAAFLAKEKEQMASGLKTLLPHHVSSSSDESPKSLDDANSHPSSTRSTPRSTPSHSASPPLRSRKGELARQDTEDSLILLDELEDRVVATEKTAVAPAPGSPSDRHLPKESTGRIAEGRLIVLHEGENVNAAPGERSEGDAGGRWHSKPTPSNGDGEQGDGSADATTFGDNDGAPALERCTNGAGDAHGDVSAQRERELLRNIYEIEQEQGDCEGDGEENTSTLGSGGNDGYDEDRAEFYSDLDGDEMENNEEDQLILEVPLEDSDPQFSTAPPAADRLSTSSLENLFDSVAEKLSLKSRERQELQKEEVGHPSSPLLMRENQSSVAVIDTTPQCV
ncbi:uncharacterized protein [Diadema antillarum]|uniref:uncharacterized protein n=1 Tax=Diadema antillarum TaxID=105358 RepID=UPI003A841CC9